MLALGAALAVLTATAALPAQRGVRLDVEVPTGSALMTDGPLVRVRGVLADRELRDLLRNGFPAQLHFRVELWSVGGWFNDLERQADWDVIVRYDPLEQTYRVARVVGEQVQTLGSFRDVAAADSTLALPFRPPITVPSARQRYYYDVKLDVEILSLNDLDEVEQWLRGEARPAVRDPRHAGTALTRGVRTLLVRLLGGERRHYEERTRTFRP